MHACMHGIELFTISKRQRMSPFNLLQFKYSIISNLRSICTNKAEQRGKKTTKNYVTFRFRSICFSSFPPVVWDFVKLIIKSQLATVTVTAALAQQQHQYVGIHFDGTSNENCRIKCGCSTNREQIDRNWHPQLEKSTLQCYDWKSLDVCCFLSLAH